MLPATRWWLHRGAVWPGYLSQGIENGDPSAFWLMAALFQVRKNQLFGHVVFPSADGSPVPLRDGRHPTWVRWNSREAVSFR